MRLERVRLEPGWLAQEIEQVNLDIMARHDPGDYFTRPLGMDARPMSDTEKHRLFMRLEARFKAWTGESFAAFMIRTGGDHAEPR